METAKDKTKRFIEDVFRRADKDDDGSLSLEEFKAFFADGILSNQELEQLFEQIDIKKNNVLDISELCEYFSKFWGPFERTFSTFDDLSSSISETMVTVSKQYKDHSHVEQFATRCLMKEIMNHLAALMRPVDSAIEILDDHACQQRPEWSEPAQVTIPSPTAVKPRWYKKLVRLQSSTAASRDENVSPSLSNQIQQLSDLIEQLENKVKLTGIEEEEVPVGQTNTVIVMSRSLETTQLHDQDLRKVIKSYAEGTTTQAGCVHIGVRSFAGNCKYVLYEVWQDQESLQIHYGSEVSKAFRRSCVELLLGPEDNKSFALPASWWPLK